MRLSVHVASGRVEWTQLVTDPHLHFEFPVISAKNVGQGCRYMYAVYSDIRYGPPLTCPDPDPDRSSLICTIKLGAVLTTHRGGITPRRCEVAERRKARMSVCAPHGFCERGGRRR